MGLFAEWQPRYAHEGIATFPLRIEGKSKKPATKGYNQVGLKGSEQLALKFTQVDAFAFMAGKRNNVTVVDIDAPDDEDLLREVLARYGDTPLISRTGSGGFHCYYRHGDEGRKVRPEPNVPVDLLGGGVLAAPPSMGSTAPYRFIRGTLADLHRLPFVRGGDDAREVQHAVKHELVKAGGRNTALLEHLRSEARYTDDLAALVDVGRTYADEHFDRHAGHPFTDDEVRRVAESAWGWTQKKIKEGQYFVGIGRHSTLSHDTIDKVMALGESATHLWLHLERRFRGLDTFFLANETRHHLPGGEWPLRKLQEARKALLDYGIIREKRKASSHHGPALYEWCK